MLRINILIWPYFSDNVWDRFIQLKSQMTYGYDKAVSFVYNQTTWQNHYF